MLLLRTSGKVTTTTFLAVSSLFGQVSQSFSPLSQSSYYSLAVDRSFAIQVPSSHHHFSSLDKSLRMSSSSSNMEKRVLVPIGDASEEIETSCITDTLTRFGASVVVATVMPGDSLVCTMSRGLKMVADVKIDDAAEEEWDLIALPGGMPGAEHLRDNETLIQLLEKQKASNKLYAAVCASPSVVLATKGLIANGATCYPAPGLRKAMTEPSEDEVVVQDNVITSQGPGTSLKFALMLGEQLYGKEKADEIAKEMLVSR